MCCLFLFIILTGWVILIKIGKEISYNNVLKNISSNSTYGQLFYYFKWHMLPPIKAPMTAHRLTNLLKNRSVVSSGAIAVDSLSKHFEMSDGSRARNPKKSNRGEKSRNDCSFSTYLFVWTHNFQRLANCQEKRIYETFAPQGKQKKGMNRLFSQNASPNTGRLNCFE